MAVKAVKSQLPWVSISTKGGDTDSKQVMNVAVSDEVPVVRTTGVCSCQYFTWLGFSDSLLTLVESKIKQR